MWKGALLKVGHGPARLRVGLSAPAVAGPVLAGPIFQAGSWQRLCLPGARSHRQVGELRKVPPTAHWSSFRLRHTFTVGHIATNKKEKGETRIRSYTQEQPFF